METKDTASHSHPPSGSGVLFQTDEEARLFILLRYVLIIAAAYLFLFEGTTEMPVVSVLLITAALASNVLLSQFLRKMLLTSFAVGLIVSVDIAWVVLGLWYKGGLEADIFILYFFILLLAGMGQRLILVVGAGLLLSAVDLTFLAIIEGQHLIFTSSSLIRVPFIFVVSIFYGYIAERVRREQHNALVEKELAGRMARVVHVQLSALREQAEDLQKSYELMKNQAQELAKSNNTKDEFLNVVSHELRTPLSLILGYVEMILGRMMGEVTSDQEGALLKVKRHSGELLGIVNSILEATKVDAGPSQLEFNTVVLGDFLDGLKSKYDFPLDKDLTLVWDYSADLPAATTDGVKLRYILENLINNAIKFTESGSVIVSACHLHESGAVQIKVTDTGIGIRQESLPFIFEKFHQADGSGTRSYGGVGLGLHIVKKFTDLLQGKIEVESEYQTGSTFTLTLPLQVERVSRKMVNLPVCFSVST